MAKDDPDTLQGGFVDNRGPTKGLVPRVPKSYELSQDTPELTPEERQAVKLQRRARSTKLAVMGISKVVLDKAEPAYANAIRMANAYRKKRSTELSEIHGHVSSGASALLATASLAMASSRYLYEKYAATGGGDMGIGMLKQAAQLADSARQSELAAWEMSAREGVAKRRLAATTAGVPWMANMDEGRKLGRKTNEERQSESVVMENGTEVYLQEPEMDS